MKQISIKRQFFGWFAQNFTKREQAKVAIRLFHLIFLYCTVEKHFYSQNNIDNTYVNPVFKLYVINPTLC